MGKQTRLDKFLADRGYGSRNDVKALIKSGKVRIAGEVCTNAGYRLPENAAVTVGETIVSSDSLFYYMLNKPAGWLSATKDGQGKVVTDLLPPEKRKGIFPVGRLDVDTTGLLLLTNDGPLSHQLLSPSRHVSKHYLALVTGNISAADQEAFQTGIDIREKKPTLPAGLQKVEDLTDDLKSVMKQYAASMYISEKNRVLSEDETSLVLVTIQEGKFHQIKRMFHAIEKEVLSLMRTGMGSLSLDPSLPSGKYRPLTEKEIQGLKGNQ